MSSFGRESTPGQTQTQLGPRVYPFTTPGCCTSRSNAGSDVVKPASSFVIQNLQTSFSMWCPMYGARYWNVVCGLFRGAALPIGQGARPHLCTDEWNCPTPVLKRLSLTQAARDKLIPTGLPPVLGTKTRSLKKFSQYSAFHL